MPPAFGFSVGDFIAGIKLVKDLIDALNETAGAKPAYRRLVSELINLERALAQVRDIPVDLLNSPQKISLEQVASQLQIQIARYGISGLRRQNPHTTCPLLLLH
ncbi:hypothetical protein VTN77DRAFT_4805 [Rasamsonia byssochlamydoides]|uniref:uncharacterized protein n=1 Tax=Rasamsonia byssochlamydoides TaxID=89139 RepID=UPI003741F470